MIKRSLIIAISEGGCCQPYQLSFGFFFLIVFLFSSSMYAVYINIFKLLVYSSYGIVVGLANSIMMT